MDHALLFTVVSIAGVSTHLIATNSLETMPLPIVGIPLLLWSVNSSSVTRWIAVLASTSDFVATCKIAIYCSARVDLYRFRRIRKGFSPFAAVVLHKSKITATLL